MNRTHLIAVISMAVGLLVVLGAGWQFLLRPLSTAYAERQAEKADLEQKLQEARERAAQYEKFQAEAENVRRDLNFYTARTEEAMPLSEVDDMVNQMGNQLALRDWTYEVKPPTPTNSNGVEIGAAKVTARFKVDFDHLGRFLNACLNQRRLLVPEHLLLKAYDDGGGGFTETVDATVDFTVYGGKGKKG